LTEDKVYEEDEEDKNPKSAKLEWSRQFSLPGSSRIGTSLLVVVSSLLTANALKMERRHGHLQMA